MALDPIDEIHALQIQAGVLGRKSGHGFEERIATDINALHFPWKVTQSDGKHVCTGNPATLLINYVAASMGQSTIVKAAAISTGALATSEEGLKWLSVNGVLVKKCKSDLVLTLDFEDNRSCTVGISTKQCNNRTPTNAQLYFTTAQGFSNLLIRNGIPVSMQAIVALKQFCGDVGHRPEDDSVVMHDRPIDPRRWFWEEIDEIGRQEWESIFESRQDEVSRLLFQKAYLNDQFAPDYLMHKTRYAAAWECTEVALYSINELIALSRSYGGFSKKKYSVKKGSYKDPWGICHDAPRFGIIQMQRGGQQQHPTQLQFNLEAGYFYKI